MLNGKPNTKSKTNISNKAENTPSIPTSQSAIVLPLTNVYAKGDYTAEFFVGSEQTPVNVIIDSGSSTLVVEPKRYQPERDESLETTPIVQEVNYGIGGWAGALVHTQLHLLDHQDNTQVTKASVAIVEAEPSQTFGDADGILGMAYHHLNKSFDISEFLAQKSSQKPSSLPWPFSIDKSINSDAKPPLFNNLRDFKSFLWKYPEHDVKPLFTQIADQHLVSNCFGFYAKRSSVNVTQADINAAKISAAQLETLKADPLNQGKLILGDALSFFGHQTTDFKTIEVLHDIYYNVHLHSVTVGDNPPITAPALAEKHVKNYYTNAIIDTGASLTVLPAELFEQISQQLIKTNAAFEQLLEPFKSIEAQYQGIDATLIKLQEWPDITFTFQGENGEPVDLICPASSYWQFNTPAKGKACFKLLSQLPNWPNQSIVGLPLISNYYVVFDRAVDNTGVIRFAEHK